MSFSRVWQFLRTLAAVFCLVSAASPAPAAAATEGLSGTAWRLVQFQDGHGQTVTPDAGSNYTVEFRTDSTVAMRLDCHRGRGTWVSRSSLQLELGPLALTRATCPQVSLRDQLAKQWTSVRSYAVRDTHLFLSLTADGGTYEFEPAQSVPAPSVAVEPPSSTPATPSTGAAPPSSTTAAASTAVAAPSIITSWLDPAKPVSWNMPGQSIPPPPKMEGTLDPRCRNLARAPELEADKRLAELGWDLIGPYQGGWGILVIQGTAGYDGMCRPQGYQAFVFVHGVFAGTLSPGAMDSRADGALNRVTILGDRRLVAEYARYTRADALCCPSRTASVAFEIASQQAIVRPVSTSTSSNR